MLLVAVIFFAAASLAQTARPVQLSAASATPSGGVRLEGGVAGNFVSASAKLTFSFTNPGPSARAYALTLGYRSPFGDIYTHTHIYTGVGKPGSRGAQDPQGKGKQPAKVTQAGKAQEGAHRVRGVGRVPGGERATTCAHARDAKSRAAGAASAPATTAAARISSDEDEEVEETQSLKKMKKTKKKKT
jgi:hypothetical protein